MSNADPVFDLTLLLSLWLGGLALALARWFDWRRLGTMASLTMIAAPSGVYVAGWSPRSLTPIGLLGAAVLSVNVWQRLKEPLRWLASLRGVQIGILLACPLMACAWVLGRPDDVWVPPDGPGFRPLVYPAGELASRPMYTDRGRAIPLYTHRADDFPTEDVRALEKRMGQVYTLGLIQTAPPEASSNCHGWVFAAGHFWVHGEDVESILHDNDYRPVESPKPGDLVIYRDPKGKPSHTGLVRFVMNREVIVESKWGHLGRFLHALKNQPYGANLNFYRSIRTDGHLLSESDSTVVGTP